MVWAGSYYISKYKMGDYDKIIKENIEAILLALGNKLLGFEIKNPVELPEKLQTTIEREPDFLKKVSSEDGSEIILHLEFQTSDEAKMVYRMAEYKALLQRKFELPVKQFVIYLGMAEPKMLTELLPEEQIVGFELRNIHKMPVDQVIESDIPEEIVLSILTDYPEADAEKVITRIIQKLKRLAPNEAELKKRLQQLVTLSRIRKLEQETEKQPGRRAIKAMPITYDIEEDYLYNKAKERVIANLLQQTSMTIEQIAKATEVSVDTVISVKNSF